MAVVTVMQSATTLLEVTRVRANRDMSETDLPVQVNKYFHYVMQAAHYT